MDRRDLMNLFEECIGCRWTIPLLRAIERGTRRPGALEKALGEISTKVLNERLQRMLQFDLIRKQTFNETLPRVEYTLTARGERIVRLLEEAERIVSDE